MIHVEFSIYEIQTKFDIQSEGVTSRIYTLYTPYKGRADALKRQLYSVNTTQTDDHAKKSLSPKGNRSLKNSNIKLTNLIKRTFIEYKFATVTIL